MLRFFLLFFIAQTSVFAQQTVGLFFHSEEAETGYVLFSNNENTYLIDGCGLVVNVWESDYKPGASVYLLPDGTLLRTASMDSNFGLGGTGGKGGRLELFSWENDLLWSYEIATANLHLHHDIAPMPNGNILVLAWEKWSAEEAEQRGSIHDMELWSERILELKPIGTDAAEIVWEWALADHLVQDANPMLPNFGKPLENLHKIDPNYRDENLPISPNWVHLNSIDYNTELDQILVSSRLFSEIWLLDHKTGELLFRHGNPKAYGDSSSARHFFYQHDAHWIPKRRDFGGQIIVFNNEKSTQSSSVEIIDPLTDQHGKYTGEVAVNWKFEAPDFYSKYMSSAEILPNGNCFICEGGSGRFFEIDQQGGLFWDYINPVNTNGGPSIQGGTVRFNQTFRARKYPADYSAFQGRKMEGSAPIELLPLENECFTKIEESVPEVWVKNVGTEGFEITLMHTGTVPYRLSDILGKSIKNGIFIENMNKIEGQLLPVGIYVLTYILHGELHSIKLYKI